MKKGIKIGARVTAGIWYLEQRAYGRIVAYLGMNKWAVVGGFGLGEFHGSHLRPVKTC